MIFFCISMRADILLSIIFVRAREDNERSGRALVSNQWHPRGERPTFSSPSTRSHVPMAVTSETMICRRRRRRAPHVNVTFCNSCVYVCGGCSAATSERCDARLSLAIRASQYIYSSARRLGNVSSRRLFAKSGV